MKFFVTVATMIGLATGTSATAQSIQDNFHTLSAQSCWYTYQEVDQIVKTVTDQQLLFIGMASVTLVVNDNSEIRVPSAISVYVDQDTSEFSILKTFDDGVTCIVTEGYGFEPYVD